MPHILKKNKVLLELYRLSFNLKYMGFWYILKKFKDQFLTGAYFTAVKIPSSSF